MNTKSPFNAHINQLADENNCLRVDGIEIRCKVSKSGEFLIAKAATEYTIQETPEDTMELEEFVDLESAVRQWVTPINPPYLVNNTVAVLCNDKVWRPLVWKGKDGKGHCFNPS